MKSASIQPATRRALGADEQIARPESQIKFIRDIHTRRGRRQPIISFEFFPPKIEHGERALLEKALPVLREPNPGFCSVTYTAPAATRATER